MRVLLDAAHRHLQLASGAYEHQDSNELDERALERFLLLVVGEVEAALEDDHAAHAVEVVGEELLPPAPGAGAVAGPAGGEEPPQLLFVRSPHVEPVT